MKVAKGPCAIAESADLLAAVGGFCSDAPTRAALRLSCLAWRNACPPARMRVDSSQLQDFVVHLCSSSGRSGRLARSGLAWLRLEGRCGTEHAAGLLIVAHRLRGWAPRLRAVELALQQVPTDDCRPYYWREVSRAFRACAPAFSAELRGVTDSTFRHVDALRLEAPKRSVCLTTFHRLKRLSIDDWPVDASNFRAPALQEFDFTPRKEWYDRRTRQESPEEMGFIPTSVKKLTLPQEWALSRGGQAMLARVGPGLEDLTVQYGSHWKVDLDDESLFKHGAYRLRFHGTSVFAVYTPDSWGILGRYQERIAWSARVVLDVEIEDVLEAAAAGVVLGVLRRVEVVVSECRVPKTHLLQRAFLRGLRRILPNVERLALDIEFDDQWDPEARTEEDWNWKQRTQRIEADEARAAERDLLQGAAQAPWPSQHVSLSLDAATEMASFFALCPTMEWTGAYPPQFGLAVECPGLRTLIGTTTAVHHAVQRGPGSITHLRLRYHKHGSVEDVVKVIAGVYAPVPRLQLQRRSDGREWWTAEEVAGLEYDVV
jgi:hypothetical protein